MICNMNSTSGTLWYFSLVTFDASISHFLLIMYQWYFFIKKWYFSTFRDRSHPGWCEGHPLMYETRVRSMNFGPWSYLRKPLDIPCCLPPPARRAPIREPWSAANLSAVKSKNDRRTEKSTEGRQKGRKIGGTLKWEEAADLIFCDINEKECSNKELKGLIKDERSMVNTKGAMLWSAENLAEVMIFAIYLRNQIIAKEALQMFMLCVMQTIIYTCYKKRIEIMKPGTTYITVAYGHCWSWMS